MKLLLLALYATAFSIKVHAQYDPQLMAELKGMVKLDQWARHLMDSVYKYGYSEYKEAIATEVIQSVDKKHNTRIKQIIRDIKSYPDNMLVGYEGARDFWLLVQHQDEDTTLQKEVLTLMKWALDYKQAPEIQYAYLVDRVRLNTGQKQLYGTQYWLNENNTAYISRPLEDSLNVNKRRAQLGMKPIEQEVIYMNERYKARIRKK